jgi:hypothetical protein
VLTVGAHLFIVPPKRGYDANTNPSVHLIPGENEFRLVWTIVILSNIICVDYSASAHVKNSLKPFTQMFSTFHPEVEPRKVR